VFSAQDHALMARALRLGARARHWARPNPHVGCVLVREGEVIGEGFSQPAGGDHAEVRALAAAGEGARGATAYVTLEPCCHHGRTPPCTEALIRAGVARVFVAVLDSNPRVDGGGVAALRQAGIDVQVGLMAAQAEAELRGFLLRQRRGRGRLRIKLAASLDGRTAMANGDSHWITGPAARRDVQRLRAESCAIVTGIGTVLADDCALTVRDRELASDVLLPPAPRRALRVVLDRQLRTPVSARVLDGEQPSLLVHGAAAKVPPELAVRSRLALGESGDGLDLSAVCAALADRECNEILLESGPRLAGAVLRAGLADELVLYLAPRLLGSDALPLFELPLQQMAQALDLQLLEQRRIGADLRLTYAMQTD
jgi:diaminohydroxyphosphoribosylaminopyrimidine deaminase/5-amino-6-(5-phosphoribosylamino)uracil reductase